MTFFVLWNQTFIVQNHFVGNFEASTNLGNFLHFSHLSQATQGLTICDDSGEAIPAGPPWVDIADADADADADDDDAEVAT